MENTNYLIIISINLGENFPINEIIKHFGQQSKTYAVIEARFNDTVLTSDSIEVSSSSVDLKTELCFQVDRKQLHSFRIERKAIKLQLFLVDDHSMDRHFVGYHVLDLRNAKNYTNNPKHEWKTLLNPKYKGSSSKRPQMSVALMINKLDDNPIDDNISEKMEKSVISDNESHDSFISQKSESSVSGFGIISGLENQSKDLNLNRDDSDIENDINVRFKDGFHHIWDSKRFPESDCKLKYIFSVTVAFADNLNKLFVSAEQIQSSKPFHFRFSLFGVTVKTKPFSDINSCDFEIERLIFNILTTDRNTLNVYFELNPTIEIQFCDNSDVLFGFVAISLSKFMDQKSTVFNPIEGSFMLLPDNETIDICEPYPIVGVSVELRIDETYDPLLTGVNKTLGNSSNKSTKDRINTKLKTSLKKESNELDLNHYCFAIDLRNIRVIDKDIPQISSSYLQFLYAFFGFTDSIKTFPSIKLKANEEVVIPHGFCAFNFATTQQKLEKTLKEVPLIIEMIEESTINTIIGTATVDLSRVLSVEPNKADAKQAVNTFVPVINEMNKTFAEIQIIMFLQNYGKTQIPISPELPEVSVMKRDTSITTDINDDVQNLDQLLVETALEIELWKEKQLILFREQLKQKENQALKRFEEQQIKREEEVKLKLQELAELESKLLNSLEELKSRENNIFLKENEMEFKQKEFNQRFGKLNEVIDEEMKQLRDKYEEKMTTEKNRLKSVESEKSKLQERVYSLERKLKEKENKIKEFEQTITELKNKTINTKNNQRVIPKDPKSALVKSITRNNSNVSNKSVSVIREPVLSSRLNSSKTPEKSNIFTRSSVPQIKANVKSVSNISSKNTTDRLIANQTKLKTDENLQKIQIIQKIKQKRNQLIKDGVPLNDPLIKEIDSELKNL